MATVTLPFSLGALPGTGVARPSSSSVTLNTAGHKLGHILRAPKDGTISAIIFRFGAITTGGDLDIRVETVNTGSFSAAPSGTLWAANTNVVLAAITGMANAWQTVTLTSGAAVTRGQLLAVVLGNVTGNYSARIAGNVPQSEIYPTVYTASWAVQNACSEIFLQYSDGSFFSQEATLGDCIGFSIATNTNPDEMGNKFTMPFSATFGGADVGVEFDGGGEIVLYDDSNTVLSSISLLSNVRNNNSVGTLRVDMPAVNLISGSTYRIVFKPASTSSNMITYMEVPSDAARESVIGGGICSYTARTDAGAWTDVLTRQTLVYPRFTAIEIASASGGGIAVLTGGGLVR